MSDLRDDRTSRRGVLKASVGALATLMLGASDAAELVAPVRRRDSRRRLVTCLADLVLPPTSTPGAGASQTVDFVLLALDQRMSDLHPEMLKTVQQALDRAARGRFMMLPRARQASVLEAFDHDCYREAAAPSEASHAWQRLKTVIATGYYTSEVGASEELVFDPVPGGFHNIELTPGFRCTSNAGFFNGFAGAL